MDKAIQLNCVLVAIVPVVAGWLAGNQFVNLSIVLFETFNSNVNFAAKIFRWIRNVLIEVVSELEWEDIEEMKCKSHRNSIQMAFALNSTNFSLNQNVRKNSNQENYRK